jgi:hypothetical protein
MHDMLLMLCYPLPQLDESPSDRLRYSMIVEACVNADVSFAQHLAPPFNIDVDPVSTGLFPPDESLKARYSHGEEDEGFVSDSVPYGWAVSAWTGDSAVGGSLSSYESTINQDASSRKETNAEEAEQHLEIPN